MYSTLVGQPYPAENIAFMEANGIKRYQIPLPAHKIPGECIPREDMVKVLLILLDAKNYPLLIHCNKGKHRTGCTIACFRKVHGWTPEAVVDEYRFYSAPKSRPLDETFIDQFDCEEVKHVATEAGLLPGLPSPPRSLREVLMNESLAVKKPMDLAERCPDDGPDVSAVDAVLQELTFD
jgi:tyrosine-protein phosphatase SIW14